jgi:uncharacterized protein (TIGR03118 family)
MSSRLFRPRSLGALAVAVPAALALAVAVPNGSALASGPGHHHVGDEFLQANLVSDLGNQGAQITDPNLKNAWGLAFSPTSPLWVADNNSGLATIYHVGVGGGTVSNVGFTVTVPGGRASTGDGSSPTGVAFNPTSGFVVASAAGSAPAFFIFSSESGQITAWNPAADPITAAGSTGQLEFSSPTAVYKGLTMASTQQGTFLYASNFHDGTVDVFNSQFQRVQLPGHFRDPFLPRGYAPFGIQKINGLIYVTYALQNAAKHDDVAGPGHGFIDIYTNDGFLVRRLVSHVGLNSPWGLALAPSGFGPFGGKLLVGNFGDGLIQVYSPFSGRHLGLLRNNQGRPIQIDNLWALKFGTAATGGTGTLLFSAGINDENDGLIGSINPEG